MQITQTTEKNGLFLRIKGTTDQQAHGLFIHHNGTVEFNQHDYYTSKALREIVNLYISEEEANFYINCLIYHPILKPEIENVSIIKTQRI